MAKPKTPPSGVPRTIMRVTEEDPTPVDAPNEMRRVTVFDFHQLRADIKNTEDRHEKIHDEIKLTIGDVQKNQVELSRQVADVRVSAAATSVSAAATSDSVKRLVAFVDTNQNAQLRLQTAEEEAAIKDATHQKKKRRELLYKIAITAVGVLGGYALALQHC